MRCDEDGVSSVEEREGGGTREWRRRGGRCVCECVCVCVGGGVRRRGMFVFWLFVTGFVEFEVREGFSSKEAGGRRIGGACVCR